MPPYRTGDVIDLTYFLSLSEGKFNTFRGLIIGTERPRNLRESLWFHSVIEGSHVTMKKKLLSPMIAKVEIVKHGSNQLRKKLFHIPALELSENRLHEPIIKGKGYKARPPQRDGKREIAEDMEVKKSKKPKK